MKYYSKRIPEDKNRSWAVNYVSLTDIHSGSKNQRSLFEREVDILFDAFQSLANPEGEILFGCHKGGVSRKEARSRLREGVAYEELATFDRKGSFCFGTKHLEVLGDWVKGVWVSAGLGNLFIVIGVIQTDSFLRQFTEMQKFWVEDFYSFACDFSRQCDLIAVSYDSIMIDIYSAKLSVKTIESALFNSAHAKNMELLREITG